MNDETYILQNRAETDALAGHGRSKEDGAGLYRMTIFRSMKRRLASGWSKSLKIRCTVSGRRILWSN